MDFALLPPEVNSGRMYSGAGAGPLLAAATAWDGLAAELQTTALTYQSVLGELGEQWSGPSAVIMTAAAAPYASWLHAASGLAEETAIAARAATAAYEAAFAMTVPPPLIAANRATLLTLIATNFLGQNTPAIAATEAHYSQMWAQDATAMYTYAGSAAAASRLTPFTQPPATTNPAAAAHSTGAVGRAVSGAAEGQATTLVEAITQALGGLTAPTAPGTATGSSTGVTAGAASMASALAAALAPAAALSAPMIELSNAGLELVVDSMGTFGVDVLGTFLIDILGAAGVGEALLEAGLTAAPVATMGSAVSISGLSVPLAWASAVPSAIGQVPMMLVAADSSAAGGAAGEAVLPGVGMAVGAAVAGLAGRATARSTGRRVTEPSTPPTRTSAPPRRDDELPELTPASAFGLLMGADGELRELAELRNAGILTDDEYTAQKRHLVGR